MKVTREVIYDLLPSYFAGDASDDTRALVEAYFETDPEFARMASRFQSLIGERQRTAPSAEERERETFACAREAAELPQKARAAALVWGFASLFAFGMAMLTWRGPMRGPWNPGVILGIAFAVGAVVTFALSFRINLHSWWRHIAGLDDEALRSVGTAHLQTSAGSEPVFLPLTPSCQEAVVSYALRGALVAALILTAWGAQAAAQDLVAPSRTLVPAVFPRWDLSGSLGMQNIVAARNPEPWRGDWDHKLEYRADAGWYWTTHLKTELTASTSTRSHDYEVETFPSGASSPVYAYTNVERRVTVLGPGLTWQFGENAFVHPYVTGGVQLWIVQQHRFRSPDTYRFGSSDQVPSIDERTTTVLGRPFVAGGFKSYISRQAFVRSEARTAFSSAGMRQLSITAGIGVDF